MGSVWASTVLEMERMKWVVDGVEEVDGGGGCTSIDEAEEIITT